MGHPAWPLFDLRVRTERLELRLATDDELVELIDAAKAGIHPPEEMPFGVPWTDAASPVFERSFLQHHWEGRATWRPERWTLHLTIFLDGRPIGDQEVGASDFRVLRTVGTGSWIAASHQGRGLGKEARVAVLALAFDGLGAEVALSDAFVDNAASTAVSRALGYEPNGVTRLAPRGVARELQGWRMTREAWLGRRRGPVAIDGLDGCLEQFGASEGATSGG